MVFVNFMVAVHSSPVTGILMTSLGAKSVPVASKFAVVEVRYRPVSSLRAAVAG